MSVSFFADRDMVEAKRAAAARGIRRFGISGALVLLLSPLLILLGWNGIPLGVLALIYVLVAVVVLVQNVGRHRRLGRALDRRPFVAVGPEGFLYDGVEHPWPTIRALLLLDMRHQRVLAPGPVGAAQRTALGTGAATLGYIVAFAEDTEAVEIDNALSYADADTFELAVRAEAAAAGIPLDIATSTTESADWGVKVGLAMSELRKARRRSRRR
ncbi:hypothetical protein NY547_06995 [Cnuibacter physcomitrellae]|uniref:hypothetical protein n=1 Tax=Cnuibacter physcomitrellae TaxID=1619308 RepID=UPI002175F603|nr:hypothetical protein [Cnuibacter physcomitrellae]MCS5496982.1 hypothetical protein [Cnuibacter physcomitrellae]